MRKIKNIKGLVINFFLRVTPDFLVGKDEEFDAILKKTYSVRNFDSKIKRAKIRNLSYYLIIFFSLIIVLSLTFKSNVKEKVYRDKDNQIFVDAKIKDFSDKISINVKKKALSLEEINLRLEYTSKKLALIIKNKNKSLNNIKSNLNLIRKYKETNVALTYFIPSEVKDYISEQGVIKSLNLKKRTSFYLKVRLSLENIHITKKLFIKLIPKKYSELNNSELKTLLRSKIDELNNDNKKDFFVLPKRILGFDVKYKSDNSFLFAVCIFLLILFLATFISRKKFILNETRKYKEYLELSFTDYMSSFIMLLSVGFPLSSVIEKIANDYKVDNKDLTKAFFNEMYKINNTIKNYNESLKVSLLDLAYRSESRMIMRFSTIINDYLDKGIPINEKLEQELGDILDRKVKLVIENGRKAENKLIFPNCLLLLSILLIAIGPVFLEM